MYSATNVFLLHDVFFVSFEHVTFMEIIVQCILMQSWNNFNVDMDQILPDASSLLILSLSSSLFQPHLKIV